MKSNNTLKRVGRLAGSVAGFLPAAQFAALGGATAILAPEASATPVASPATSVNIPITTSGVYINVVTGVTSTTPSGSPGWDLNPWGSSTLNTWANNPASPNDGVMTAPGGSATLVGNLSAGTLVDGTGSFVRTGAIATTGTGQFQTNATNYIGFRFLNESDGLIHFGWASVIVGAAFNTAGRNVGEIWYESAANTGILVGDTGAAATPEPSSVALLAMGAAGLLAARRRRQQSC